MRHQGRIALVARAGAQLLRQFLVEVLQRAVAAQQLLQPLEFARIGQYYASESMLVLDPNTGRYDEAATPSHGQRSLFDFYQRVITQHTQVDLGDHAVF